MAASNGIMDKGTTAASYGTSIGTAAAGFLSLNEWALLLGIVFAALTFAINWRYQHKRDVREHLKHNQDSEYHRARMQSLISSGVPLAGDKVPTEQELVEHGAEQLAASKKSAEGRSET